jgi:signal transduction histidine kinase
MRSDRILIVEADKRLRLSRVDILMRDGYSVTDVATIEKAVRIAREEPWDLLIIGIEQPVLLDALPVQFPPEISILMIVPEDTVGCVTENAGTGIRSFLIPPVTPRRLRKRVSQVIDSARQVKESIRGGFLTSLENTAISGSGQKNYLQMQRLLQEISTAQENERRRVAVEIHDGVAQWMVGASYGIKACSTLVSELRLNDLRRELAETEQAVQRSIKELRRTIANLRPLPLEEMGIVAAVRQIAATLAEDSIICHTEVDIDLPRLSVPEETTTYRIIQEMLTNVRRHSGASEVTVHMHYHDGMYSVAVRDNGQGFVPEEVLNNEMSTMHMGLIGMKERAGLLGGCLTIDSGHGKGTAMCFAFPVSTREIAKATATVRD